MGNKVQTLPNMHMMNEKEAQLLYWIIVCEGIYYGTFLIQLL